MASQQLPEAKDQHYIPKFYLKGFTDKDGVLWVCERFKPIRSSKPKLEAHRPDYYSHTEKGERDETAENALEEIESRAAPIIRKLANPQYVPTPENANHLIVFVGFMFARVPSWRENLDRVAAQVARQTQVELAQDNQKFRQLYANVERSTGRSVTIEAEELRQFILKGDYELVQKSMTFNLAAMFITAVSLIRELEGYGMQIFHAPEGMFYLTSDSPVYTIQPDGSGQATVGMGFGWPDVEVYFPLNKRACLRMRRGIQAGARVAEEGRVKEINNLVMATAARYLYSSEGHRRIARLFNERGCKVQPGKNAFMSKPRPYEFI